MFSQVSVCPRGGGGVSAPLHTGVHPLGRHPQADTPSSWADTPLCSACWDTVNKRAVRIPLECILVLIMIKLSAVKLTTRSSFLVVISVSFLCLSY